MNKMRCLPPTVENGQNFHPLCLEKELKGLLSILACYLGSVVHITADTGFYSLVLNGYTLKTKKLNTTINNFFQQYT